MNPMRVAAERLGRADAVGLYFYSEGPGAEERRMVEPLVFKEQVVDVHSYVDPTWMLNRHLVQQLMDELWRVGVRPSGQPDPAPTIDALKAHLADLRAVAFKELGIKP